MSFYFAHQADPNTKQVVSQGVKDKGLSLLRAKPCDVQVSVLTFSAQLGYACYTRNFPAFMEATLTSTTVLISNRGYPIKEVPLLLPWTLPRVIYDFKTSPTDAKKDLLMKHSELIKGRGKNVSFVMHEPTPDKIKTLVNDGANMKTPHLIGTVNIEAMKTVLILRKILSAFLLTHVYPAFRHDSDLAPVKSNNCTTSTKRRKVENSTYFACITNVEENTTDIDEMEEENELYAAPNPDTEIELSYAKPTPITNDRWGSIPNIPNASGLYVPYVKELAVDDNITVISLVSRYFIRCLASDIQGMFKTINSMRSAWGLISTTELGKEITHLCKCIDIAIQAQAIVYPVYSGTIYEGTVICGAGYSIGLKDEVITPRPYAKLQSLVRDASAHNRSIEEICLVMGNRDCVDAKNMRELSSIVKATGLNAIEQQTIVKAACNLSFMTKYWSTSTANVKRMMVLLLNPDAEIDQDVPMHPTYLFSTNHVELVLSAFGHQAPTFLLPNGSNCQLSMETPPKNFHYRTVALNSAISDMKYVLEHGFITNNIQNLSSQHRDTALKGNDKGVVWKFLKRVHEMQGEEATAEKATTEVSKPGSAIDDDLW